MKNNEYSKIAIIIGTKAELIKCMPIMLELQKQKKDYWFIHTGQHPLKQACEKFGVKKPDFVLSKVSKKSTKFWSKINQISIIWSFLMIKKIKKIINQLKPKYIIYHGDTMSTAVASIASSKLLNPRKNWHNVHLEAGLRSDSFFEPFPEEISRKICDLFSDTLFAVSYLTEENLKKENKKGRILHVGNTIVDSATITYELAKRNNKKKKERYFLVNIHRHENLRKKERMEKIIKILKSTKIKGIWPLHDNTEYYLNKYGLMQEVKKIKNIKIMPLVNYSEFIFLMANCDYLITDGGSIQEESLIFKKPCVILRKKTERKEGLRTGINFLTKLDVKYSKSIIKKIEEKKMKVKDFKNPYGKVGLSKKIVKELLG